MNDKDKDSGKVALRIGVLTVSDTRKPADDRSGDALVALLQGDGHRLVKRAIVADSQTAITAQVKEWLADTEIDVVISTGGTGLTGRDVTPEAVEALYDKAIPGFGELFRWLSYAKIGPACLQSRATGGIAKGKYLFALPGSPSACRDAWEMILRHQFDSRQKPCNFVSLMPRLTER